MVKALNKNLKIEQFTGGNHETDEDVEEIERICDRNYEYKNENHPK